MKPLFTGSEWSIDKISRVWDAIELEGKQLGYDFYRPQIEIISSEQMLDAYSSVAMPIMYNHWSFGKSFIKNQKAYKDGKMGLAYEVVINTDPCLVYLMEDNTMTMQTLVMAHAGVGHSSFFKNNYLFQEWTDAGSILDYLKFARDYVRMCEARYGEKSVTKILDACHAIQYYGVDKYKRPPKLKEELKQERLKVWEEYIESNRQDIWKTLPQRDKVLIAAKGERFMLHHRNLNRDLPEENILYYIEKNSVKLKPWEKELVRIVRMIAQYFYPQMQTQLMNEGWATFTHYVIMNNLWEKGLLTEGSHLEFLENHCNVVAQPDFDDPRYGGINVYALGFAMMRDLQRICENPDDEDKYWFPDLAGQDWKAALPEIVEQYRDESFVLQFLSPKVIRQFKLFSLMDLQGTENYTVRNVHRDEDVLDLREKLSKQYSLTYKLPQVEVKRGKPHAQLELIQRVIDKNFLEYNDAKKVILYLERLWGEEVLIDFFDEQGKPLKYE